MMKVKDIASSFILRIIARNKINTILRSNRELKLDLGCGSIKKNDFIGIDLSRHADIRWNLEWGIPFDDNSVSEISSDHFFEHLDLDQVIDLLKECYRVLELGGEINLSVPHFDPYLDAYIKQDKEFLQEKIIDVPSEYIGLYDTCFDLISWLLHRRGEHKSLFDKQSIISKMRMAGFDDVDIRDFDEDKDVNYRFSSIYVVAKK